MQDLNLGIKMTLCAAYCVPGYCLGGSGNGVKRGGGVGFFPPRSRLVFCAHSTAPFHQTLQIDLVLPCPCLPAHCVGTSDFMKFLRSHLHPVALKSLPARGVEAAGRNQEATNNTLSLGDASVQESECLGQPPPQHHHQRPLRKMDRTWVP